MEDINKCRVPREYLERWSNEPFFDKAVKGCFIRVARGEGRGGERLYVMAEIAGVVPYKRRYKIVSVLCCVYTFEYFVVQRLRSLSCFLVSVVCLYSFGGSGGGAELFLNHRLNFELGRFIFVC